MKKIVAILFLVFAFCVLIGSGCTKDFLDAKPSTNILQPVTLDEFQKLLDNQAINTGIGLGILAADEYKYSSDATWLSISSAVARNSYIWAKDLYEGNTTTNWNAPYFAIFYANNILVGIDKIKVTPLNSKDWNKTKGWALFTRAYAYYELVNNFSPFYDESTASTDLGVPLRLNPSIDEILQRSTVKETFTRIFKDLKDAASLLDGSLPDGRTRASKVAVHALLARIYLNNRDYSNAELNADTCLNLYNKLIDYNTISKTATTPFGINHDEQIYAKAATPDAAYTSSGTNASIDMMPELISLYEANDLRLVIYFNKQSDGTYDMKRSYNGANNPFVGLATDEVYLIKAECLARRSEPVMAMTFLNQLKIKRWNPNATSPAKPYQNMTASNSTDALSKVLLERRKELVWRGLRWDDIRRLNKEGANITLTRTINGQTYTLTPNDVRYVFPIPDNEINLSGIQQNQR